MYAGGRGEDAELWRASAPIPYHLSFLDCAGFDIHSTILFGGNANKTIATITIRNTTRSIARAIFVA